MKCWQMESKPSLKEETTVGREKKKAVEIMQLLGDSRSRRFVACDCLDTHTTRNVGQRKARKVEKFTAKELVAINPSQTSRVINLSHSACDPLTRYLY